MTCAAACLGFSLLMLFIQIDAYIALSNGIGDMLCRNESLWSEIDKDNEGTASVDEMTKFALATGVHDVLLKLERTDPNYYGIGLGEDGRKNLEQYLDSCTQIMAIDGALLFDVVLQCTL